MSKKRVPILVICALLLFVSACGDGSAENIPELDISASINRTPIANISGLPSQVTPGQSITLDGSSSSDPDSDTIAAYAWELIGSNSIIASGTNQPQMTFVVPNETTTITIKLIVVDSKGKTSEPTTATIAVTANGPSPPPPTTPNAIFVSDSLGSDNPSSMGTYALPTKTISHGIALANAQGMHIIYVMNGTYVEELTLPSDIHLIGNVESFGADGALTMSPIHSGLTIIEAPSSFTQAILIQNVSNVQIEGFKIIGGNARGDAYGISADNVENLTILENTFETPGNAGARCRDVNITASRTVLAAKNKFATSGNCDDYIGLNIDSSENINLTTNNNGGNEFSFADTASELYLKAISVLNSNQASISFQNIASQTQIQTASYVSAINTGNSTAVSIESNNISIAGARQIAGIVLNCGGAITASPTLLSDNNVQLSLASEKQRGITVTCEVENNSIDIEKNRVFITPPNNLQTIIRGIDTQAQLRPLILRFINNIISLKTADIGDASKKSAIALSKLGNASDIRIAHNSLLVTGNSGELYALSSDRPDVQFSSINNIFFVFGANTNNAVFSLKSQCENTAPPYFYCAKQIESNLMNSKINRRNLPLIYFYDTGTLQTITSANYCDANPASAQCANNIITRTTNFLESSLSSTAFDLDIGELTQTRQQLVTGRGHPAGITTDINGNIRSSTPDIGAVEY